MSETSALMAAKWRITSSDSTGWLRELGTDYDLWGTKVAGPVPFIEALLTDTGIEAIRLPALDHDTA